MGPLMRPSGVSGLATAIDEHQTSTARFLMRWTGFEALLFRVIVEIAHDKGWSIKDAQIVVDSAKLSRASAYRSRMKMALERTVPINPKAWEAILKIEDIRNMIVHGVAGHKHDKLDVYSAFLKKAVKKPEVWIDPTVVYGGLLTPRTKHKSPHPISDLMTLLKVKKLREHRKLPRLLSDAEALCDVASFGDSHIRQADVS